MSNELGKAMNLAHTRKKFVNMHMMMIKTKITIEKKN